MSDETPTRANQIAETVKAHYEAGNSVQVRKPGDVTGKGFVQGRSGNPDGMARQRGLVALIKGKTNNFESLIDLLYKVHKGQSIDGRKPSLRDIIDATKELLDRGAGKPVQMQVVTGDDTAKDLLATRQKALALQEAESTSNSKVAEQDSGVSGIESMRRAKEG